MRGRMPDMTEKIIKLIPPTPEEEEEEEIAR